MIVSDKHLFMREGQMSSYTLHMVVLMEIITHRGLLEDYQTNVMVNDTCIFRCAVYFYSYMGSFLGGGGGDFCRVHFLYTSSQ